MSLRMRFVAVSLAALAIASATAGESDAAPPDKKKIEKKTDKKTDKKTPAKKAGAASTPPPPPGPAAAKPAPPPTLAPIELKLDITRTTLPNGLRVVMNPERGAPTVAIAVTYDVGGRDDEPGRTGFAHLFEHLMFEGSKNVGRGEHHALVYARGGTHDATTSVDRTNYYEVLPASELALGLWLEADRMKSLAVTAESLESQRKVVQEEFRMRVTNAPYKTSGLKLEELVYQGYAPYGHPGLAAEKDLDAAKLDEVAAFHARHYGPNTAVVAISGDFDPAEARGLVEKYFGAIPKIEAPKFVAPELPQQTSQRTLVVRDDNARSPLVIYGWPVPPAHAADHDALEVAAEILAGGESSRLHQLLVRDKGLAQWVYASPANRRGPDLFSIWISIADGVKPPDVEKIVEAEIKALATKPPSDEELERAKRKRQTATILALQTNLARATKLGELEIFFDDASILNKEPARTVAIGKDDVKRVADKWLGPLTRTIVETLPPEGASPPVVKPAPAPAKAAAPAPPPKKGDKKAADKKADKKGDKKGGDKKTPPKVKP